MKRATLQAILATSAISVVAIVIWLVKRPQHVEVE